MNHRISSAQSHCISVDILGQVTIDALDPSHPRNRVSRLRQMNSSFDIWREDAGERKLRRLLDRHSRERQAECKHDYQPATRQLTHTSSPCYACIVERN